MNFPDFGKIIFVLFVVCCVSVPLGLWKIVDLIIFAAKHISITVK